VVVIGIVVVVRGGSGSGCGGNDGGTQLITYVTQTIIA